MKLLPKLLGLERDLEPDDRSYVCVMGEEVEVSSSVGFSGEMLERGARIASDKHDFTIDGIVYDKGEYVAWNRELNASINISLDLKEVHWSHCSLTDLLETGGVEKSKFTDEQIADAFSKAQETPEFKLVLDAGAALVSSKLQIKRGVMRFDYDNRLDYLIFPTGKIRSERKRADSSYRQTLYKRNTTMTNDPLENYKRMLKRLAQILERRDQARHTKQGRDEALSKPAKKLGDLKLPSAYPASLEISKKPDLVSLEGGPISVNGDFRLQFLPNLVSIEGSPKTCKSFSIHACPKLASLRGGPKKCQYFSVDGSPLVDLEGSPECISINLHNMGELKSLRGMHKVYKNGVSVYHNVDSKATLSLEGVGRDFLLECAHLMIKATRVSHVLGLCFVNVHSATYVGLEFPGGDIMKKYLGKGHEGIIDAQHELIEAGLEDIAKL